MEKETRTIYKKELVEHSFYCDSCNEYLGTTEEYDDGWYDKLGRFELKFFVANEWLYLEKCLCDTCRDNLVNNMKSILKSMGFED